MNHKIKMIGLDLDGTLLTTEKKLTAYTEAVLKKALEQGIFIVISTGRSLLGIPKDIREIPGMKYAVTVNGAKVIDIETEEIIYEKTLPIETALHLLDLVSEYDAIQEAFIDGVTYSSKAELEHAVDYFLHPSSAEYVLKTRTPVEDVKAVVIEKGRPVEKVNGMFRTAEDKKSFYKKVLEVPGVVAASSLGNNCEMNCEGTDKGNALLMLGKMLGIQREEIMACGDGMNDLAMLEAVGFAVAMENADQEVKAAADYITISNDEDGVAKAIEKFALR